MKASSKFQKYIVNDINSLITELTDEQKNYFITISHTKPATRLKSNVTTCLSCSTNWNYTKKNEITTCNICNSKLIVSDTKQRKFNYISYTQIITTVKDIQIIRNFQLHSEYKKGEQPSYRFDEISRLFLDENGNYEVIGKYKQSYYNEYYQGNLELRQKCSVAKNHNLYADCVFPKIKVIKQIKRNGFKKGFHRIRPFTLFLALLTENKAETIFKAKFYNLFEEIFLSFNYSYNSILSLKSINYYWDSIKIAIKNNYKIEDVSLWLDYLKMLEKLGKDLRNAHFVCPTDLHSAHQNILEQILKQNIKEQKEKDEAKQQLFQLAKNKYFSLSFKDVDLLIEPIKTIYGFEAEGKELNHCVYTNDYISRKNSLLFSAKIDNQRVETVEVSLVKFKVMQSRGNNNQNSDNHSRIISLVESSMDEIRKVALSKKVA